MQYRYSDGSVNNAQPFVFNNIQYGKDVFKNWTPEQLAEVGVKEFIEDSVPEHYRSGVPVDVETSTQVHRTYPNPVFEPEPWRTQLSNAIQQKKITMRDGGFMIDEVLFDSDAGANIAYLNFYTRITVDPTYTTMWKASGNTWVEMNATLFTKVSAGFQQNMEAAFTWQATTDAALSAAPDTYEALKAIEDLIKEVN